MVVQYSGMEPMKQEVPRLSWVYLAGMRFTFPNENKVESNNTASVIATRRCLHRNFFIMINFGLALTLLHGFSASPIWLLIAR